MMAYDRYGRAKPTPRDGAPGRAVTVAVCAFVVLLLGLCAWLGVRQSPDAGEPVTSIKRHDSLAPTYTYDGDCIRWYVLVDPDTNVQYLVNDRGGCTPRLDKFGRVMGTTTDPM